MTRRSNVDLITEAVGDLGEATTNEIIGWIRREGVSPPPPRVVSQICSCLPIVEKKKLKGGYVVWGKAKDFEERLKKLR